MRFHDHIVVACIGLALLVAGCAERSAPDAPATPGSVTPRSKPATDAWVGRWNGAEGTFLELAGNHGSYQIAVRNLDGPRVFAGEAVGDRIQFERDGIKETIRATNGRDTGMKWLADKSNCLTVRPGEGYCRD